MVFLLGTSGNGVGGQESCCPVPPVVSGTNPEQKRETPPHPHPLNSCLALPERTRFPTIVGAGAAAGPELGVGSTGGGWCAAACESCSRRHRQRGQKEAATDANLSEKRIHPHGDSHESSRVRSCLENAGTCEALLSAGNCSGPRSLWSERKKMSSSDSVEPLTGAGTPRD
ncbi:unnamed protein product [Pleuronectes platessa]|uniref:Uncharacterized protein n=1 Tax=Pleuronectes platessa TaxID=8262 RepID=A0A9N7U2V0_PLEPL|nr:unnamed protein product [Pleuronectes platessa]